MAKIIDVESGVDSVEEVVDPSEKAKNETEEMIQRLMKKAYLLGMSTGMRTMCSSVLEKLNQGKNLNPQKQLMGLRQWLNQTLTMNNKTSEENKSTTNNNDKEDNTNA